MTWTDDPRIFLRQEAPRGSDDAQPELIGLTPLENS